MSDVQLRMGDESDVVDVAPTVGSIIEFLAEYGPPGVRYYRSGKAVLHDILNGLAAQSTRPAAAVVLPACVPSGVGEVVRASGLEPRYHPVTRTLAPDLEAVEASVDDRALAIISVDYFGFPQPGHDRLEEIATAAGVPLIEDNAHAPLSRTPTGELLGTRGDLGFTSFHKSLPVRDGAALYGSDTDPGSRGFTRAGVSDRYSFADGQYLLGRWLTAISGVESMPRLTDPTGWLRGEDRATRLDGFGRDQTQVYVDDPRPMSRLTHRSLSSIDPGRMITEHRQAYARWLATIDGHDGIDPLAGTLPAGVWPTCCPVVVDDRAVLERVVDGSTHRAPRWPPLPHEVLVDDRFETARYLADHLALLPIP